MNTKSLSNPTAVETSGRRHRLATTVASLITVIVIMLSRSHQIARTEPAAAQRNWGQARAVSAEMTAAELAEIERCSQAALGYLLHADLSPGSVNRKQATPRSTGDLDGLLQQELEDAHDPYASLTSVAAYETMCARRSGKSIGVDLDLRYGQSESQGYFTAQPLVNSAALPFPGGILKGDIVLAIDDNPLQAPESNGYAMQQQAQAYLDEGGPLGSTVSVTILRGRQQLQLRLVRQIVKDQKEQGGTHVGDVFLPCTSRSSCKLPQAKSVDIDNLFNEMALPKLIAELKAMRAAATPTRGIVLDLTEVKGSDGETALRVAALFMTHGTISRTLNRRSDGNIECKIWEVIDGAVRCRTRAPLASKAGVAVALPNTLEHVETLDWPCALFAGEVVVLVGSETSGGGEVIAAALANDTGRCVVAGEVTAGKGLAQTSFQLGHHRVLCLSTVLYLKPDGQALEGCGVSPSAVNKSNQQAGSFAAILLEKRFQSLPDPPPTAIETPDDPFPVHFTL